MNSMRQYLLATGLLLLTAGAQANRDPGQYFFDQSLGDFQEELQMARDEGKVGVLIFFEMEECPFCHRMKTTVLNQPEVQDYYKEHFLIYPVDIEGDVEIVEGLRFPRVSGAGNSRIRFLRPGR